MSNTIYKMSVYVAGPMYSSGLLDQNIRRALHVGSALEEIAGRIAVSVYTFIPHASVLTRQLVTPRSEETAQEWDDYWIRKCDALFRIQGNSKGSDHEVALAKQLCMPIAYDYEQFAEIVADFKEHERESER